MEVQNSKRGCGRVGLSFGVERGSVQVIKFADDASATFGGVTA